MVAEHPHGTMEETSPIMPHLVYSATELDHLFPSLEAPREEELHDYNRDATDTVLVHGQKLAEAIRVQSETDGRRRRPRDELSPVLNLHYETNN